MIEFLIFKCLCISRENFFKYKNLDTNSLKRDHLLLYRIYCVITHLYTKHEYGAIKADDLLTGYLSLYPVLKPVDRGAVEEAVKAIFAAEVKESLLNEYLETHRDRAFAGELAIKSLAVAEGRGSLADIDALRNAYKARGCDTEPEYIPDDLETLYGAIMGSGGLYWPWGCLNRSLGPLRRGNMGFIFARSETGKTTWLSHFATFTAQHIGQPILWINNEEEGQTVQIRFYQSALGMTAQDLFKDRKGNTKKYKSLTKGLLKLKDSAILDREEIESLCKQEKPGLIVIDQLDKVYGFTNDRFDLELGERYIWARELAKEYCPVIGATQASANAEGVKYLTAEHIANSKTSKISEADFVIGIGASRDGDFPYYRYLNVIKNKLLGDENTITSDRHGKFQLVIEPDIARYREIE